MNVTYTFTDLDNMMGYHYLKILQKNNMSFTLPKKGEILNLKQLLCPIDFKMIELSTKHKVTIKMDDLSETMQVEGDVNSIIRFFVDFVKEVKIQTYTYNLEGLLDRYMLEADLEFRKQ